MSVFIKSLFTPDELILEREFLKARDMLLGENCVIQNINGALDIAAASKHPQCQWLASLFDVETVITVKAARLVFMQSKTPAALCFAAILSCPINQTLLSQSADMGYALAQAEMNMRTNAATKFCFAKSAASQRERDGFYRLGWCYEVGIGCKKNLVKAKEYYAIGAQFGHINSMFRFSDFFNRLDPQRWIWLGRCALFGHPLMFLFSFSSVIEKFKSDDRNSAAVLQIGKVLNGHIHVDKRTFFNRNNNDTNFHVWIGPAKIAVSFYKSQLSACRLAVDTWTFCCLRLRIYKDIRVLIGKLVWESRDLALYTKI